MQADRPPSIAADEAARAFATDPRHNVVLEASAGTGKTSVLVARYLNLLAAGVDPANILAITFTRKAAAEMRARILRELRASASRSAAHGRRWRELRNRAADIAVGTIDAFCLSLLREFPLEADLDPAFALVDESDARGRTDDALDKGLQLCTALATTDDEVAMVLATLAPPRTRAVMSHLLARRLTAPQLLRERFAGLGPASSGEDVIRRAASSVRDLLERLPGGVEGFLADGAVANRRFQMFVRDVRTIRTGTSAPVPLLRAALDGIREHFCTQQRTARVRPPDWYRSGEYPSEAGRTRHVNATRVLAPAVSGVLARLDDELMSVLGRSILRMFEITVAEYRRRLEAAAVLDFSEALARALHLLRQMDQFSRSRFRLESRYHHILVDEFQDTSHPQWELISLLIQAWGEGTGMTEDAPLPPSIFIVGDRKQSIYRFRDADVALLDLAAGTVAQLRPDHSVHRWIARSFRASPALLAFVNDVFAAVPKQSAGEDAFRYDERDQFPLPAGEVEPYTAAAASGASTALGVVTGESPDQCASALAAEIERVLGAEDVRDRETGVWRRSRPGDIAILFRTREAHRTVEGALTARGIPAYVYKGLGFFDADEVKDVLALVRYFADPGSHTRAAALLRSRIVRLSDQAVALLAPDLAGSILHSVPDAAWNGLSSEDRELLARLQESMREWLPLVDRVPPAELLDRVLEESAYAFELRGRRRPQARETLKKIRGLVRRIQNRGYPTFVSVAAHLDRLATSDEADATIDACEAVNLMTVHASKGLEFPIVFVANLTKGTGTSSEIIRLPVGGGAPVPLTLGPGVAAAGGSEEASEREETKRLLYVAVTRARDRLYLSAPTSAGKPKPGRGSLAEVLPATFLGVLAEAASADQDVAWTGPSGRVHRLRVCRPPEEELRLPEQPSGDLAMSHEDNRLGRLPTCHIARVSVTDPVVDGNPSSGAPVGDEHAAGHPLTGTLVRRLLQRGRGQPLESKATLYRQASALLKGAEREAGSDLDGIIKTAIARLQALRQRQDVMSLLESGDCLYEVPVSFRADGSGVSAGDDTADRPVIVRGSVDCLVCHPDGRFSVVELKTGAPHPSHLAELELYVNALRSLLPGAQVAGTVVYG